MSLLTNFVASEVVKQLEAEIIKHEPHLQDAFLYEVAAFADVVQNWIVSKLEKTEGLKS